MTSIVLKIGAEQTYAVRQKVLRPRKPIESAHFEGDDLVTTHHFGFELDGEIVGVLSLFEIQNDFFSAMLHENMQYQLRGMAVLAEHQKKNIGNQLMDFAENFVRAQKVEIIWCNARESATGFYTMRGYKIIGDVFTITDIGNHFKMFKIVQ